MPSIKPTYKFLLAYGDHGHINVSAAGNDTTYGATVRGTVVMHHIYLSNNVVWKRMNLASISIRDAVYISSVLYIVRV